MHKCRKPGRTSIVELPGLQQAAYVISFPVLFSESPVEFQKDAGKFPVSEDVTAEIYLCHRKEPGGRRKIFLSFYKQLHLSYENKLQPFRVAQRISTERKFARKFLFTDLFITPEFRIFEIILELREKLFDFFLFYSYP